MLNLGTVEPTTEAATKAARFSIWLPLCVLCLAQFLASADNVTLSIATGVLMRDLGATLGQISKANTMYPLVAGTFMVAGGMLGLIIGWMRTFRLGCVIYLLAEVCAVLAPSIDFFVYIARVLAGIGGSFMIPSVFGLITGTYSRRHRALAFGALGAASGVSFALAPIVCELLLSGLGWCWAFGVMGVVAILILVCSPLIPAPARPQRKIRFDTPGFILSTIGLFLVIFGLLQVPVWGVLEPFHPPFTVWGLSPALFLVAAGLVVLALMLRREGHCEKVTGSALVPRAFLRTPQVRVGLYMTAYIFFAYSSGVFIVVSFVQIVGGLDAIRTGMLIVPFAICMASCSLGLPVFIKQRKPRRQCRIGLLLGLCGAIVTACGIQPHDFSTLIVTLGLCLIGACMGTLAANAPFLVTSALPEREAQQSGGVQAAARDVGQALGVALVSMVMLTAITFNMKGQAATDTNLSAPSRLVIETLTVMPYLSDAGFETLMTNSDAVLTDLPQLNQLYQQSRAKATRWGILSMGVMTLPFMLSLRRRFDDVEG